MPDPSDSIPQDLPVRVMGFRAEKDTVHWALVTGTFSAPELCEQSQLTPPPRLTEPGALRWLRIGIRRLLERHSVDRTAVHLVGELPNARPTATAYRSILRRARFEGVLLEVCWARKRALVFADESRKASKAAFRTSEGEPVFWPGLKSWSRRQAIMVAAAALDDEIDLPV